MQNGTKDNTKKGATFLRRNEAGRYQRGKR